MCRIIKSYKNIHPNLNQDSYVFENTSIIGDVHIGQGSSIWYGSVIRGDVNKVRIGEYSNIQDGTVVHVATFGQGTHIGHKVTVGHQALLHDCTIEDKAYIGMQVCIMDGATVKTGAFVAAGSLVTPGKIIPTGELWGGRPAKFMRKLNKDDYKLMDWSWSHYHKLAVEHNKSE